MYEQVGSFDGEESVKTAFALRPDLGEVVRRTRSSSGLDNDTC